MSREVKSILGKRDKNSAHHWKKLDVKSYEITHPTVICLSGSGSYSEMEANGFCKLAENLMGMYFEEKGVSQPLQEIVDIIGYSYGKDYPDDNVGSLTNAEQIAFARNILLPLCCDENGKKLNLEAAKINMSNITFFTFCHGATEAYEILYDLNQLLLEKNFSENDIIEIMSEMLQVSYSPNTDARIIPTVEVLSKKDEMNGAKIESKDIPNGLNIEYVMAYTNDNQQADIISIETDSLMSPKVPEEDEHLVNIINRDETWSIFKIPDKEGNMASIGENADVVSQLVGYSLARSVAVSIQNMDSADYIPKPQLIDLKEELDTILQPSLETDLQAPEIEQ